MIYANQIQEAIELIKSVEYLPIVLDHIAKPSIKTKSIQDWEKDIRALAKYPNLYCKISGMATEADWTRWKAEDLKPYLDIVVEAFGVDRLLFGSDWPVCLVASSYERWLHTIKDYFKEYPESDTMQQAFDIHESYNLQWYAKGGGFKSWHHENAGNLLHIHRHLVFMTYLNDVTEGGETEFYHQNVKVKPERGLTLIWPGDWTHTHRGLRSKTQDKYIITGWFHYVTDQDFKAIMRV